MRQGRRRLVLLTAGSFVLRTAGGADAKPPVLGLLWIDSVKPSPFSSTLVLALQKKGYAVDRGFRIKDGVVQEPRKRLAFAFRRRSFRRQMP